MQKVVLFILWVVVFMFILSTGCGLVTYPSTIANLCGIVLLVGFGCLSVKTKCFTQIKLTNKK
jgi:hypothetical protein